MQEMQSVVLRKQATHDLIAGRSNACSGTCSCCCFSVFISFFLFCVVGFLFRSVMFVLGSLYFGCKKAERKGARS